MTLPLYTWFDLPQPEEPERQTCSRGCHLLPATARFDPHTGRPLVVDAVAPRARDRVGVAAPAFRHVAAA